MRLLRILAAGILLSFFALSGAQAQQANSYWCNSATVPCPPSAWTPASAANPVPTTSSGGGGGGAVTIADGADVTLGAIADAAATAGSTGTLSAKLRLMTTQLGTIDTTLGTPFQANGALGAGTNRVGYTSDDPCTQKIKLNAPFSTSSAGPVSIVALSGSTVIYVCSISAITDTAIKLSFIDGTGGSCASAQHAIWGSTTAANGMSLAANGGFTQGSGNGSVGVTTAASAFCLLQSGTSLVAGNVTYVQQ